MAMRVNMASTAQSNKISQQVIWPLMPSSFAVLVMHYEMFSTSANHTLPTVSRKYGIAKPAVMLGLSIQLTLEQILCMKSIVPCCFLLGNSLGILEIFSILLHVAARAKTLARMLVCYSVTPNTPLKVS